jgi:ATPase subunit of ABC transporter with duplicated ATPase domains
MGNQQMKRYKGNYDAYDEQRYVEERRLLLPVSRLGTLFHSQFATVPLLRFQQEVREESAREKDEKKRGQLESFIAKNIGGGAKGASMAKSRQKMLAKMSSAPEQDASDPTVRFKIPNPGMARAWMAFLRISLRVGDVRQTATAEKTATAENDGADRLISTFYFTMRMAGSVAGGFGIRLVGVGFHYPNSPMLFSGVEFSINQNSRICLVGPNGIGKSTLLKIVFEVRAKEAEGLV